MRRPTFLVSLVREGLKARTPVLTLPRVCRNHHEAARRLSTKEIKQEFENLFPVLVKDLVEDPQYHSIPLAVQWQKDVLEVNCAGGKMNRGITVVETLQTLKNDQLTDEELHDASVIGLGLEMMQSYYLLLDDYIDQSETRRGRPCWFRTRNLGPKAINDGFLIESSIYEVFNKRLSRKPFYRDVVHLFKDMNSKSIIGEALDLRMSSDKESRKDLSIYTAENYDAICKFKSSYYTIYMPVAAAMLVAGVKDKAAFDAVWRIALPLGIYFQEQDDYLDLYGDPAVTGKVGTDIKEGKCTWFAVQTMICANDSQKKIFQDHYGSADEESVQKIKALYAELQLQRLFQQHMEDSFAGVRQQIAELPKEIPGEIFHKTISKIFNRVK